MKRLMVFILMLISINAFTQTYEYKYNIHTSRQDMVLDTAGLGDTAKSVYGADTSYWGRNAGKLFLLNNTDSVGIGVDTPNNIFQVKNLIEFDNTLINTFIGYQSGINNIGGANNTSLGYKAGLNHTNGVGNSMFGQEAGKALTNGNSNTLVGLGSGIKTATGSNNTLIGYAAGYSNVSGSNNTMLGYQVGFNETGSNKLYIGNNSSDNPLIHGDFAEDTLRINGSLKVADTLTVGNVNQNNIFQVEDLIEFDNILKNTFNGYQSGISTTTGANNTAFGYQAGASSTEGIGNSLFGYVAGASITTGDYNTMLGNGAGAGHQTGDRNVFIGGASGYNNITGSGNIFLGYTAGQLETGSDRLYIDNTSTSSPLLYGEFDNNKLTTNGSHYITDSLSVGVKYSNHLFQVKDLIDFNSVKCHTFLGDSAGANSSATTNNTLIGYHSGYSLTDKQNVFIGCLAGFSSTSARNNVIIGESAGYQNTTGDSNVMLGRKAGENNTTGSSNTFVGKESGRYNDTGANNNGFGANAMKNNITGSINAIFGNNATQNCTSIDSTVVFGNFAVSTNDIEMSQNVIIGTAAGNALTTKTAGSVLIGNNVANFTGGLLNRLYIDNSNTTTPLIYGEFDNDLLRVNGELQVDSSFVVRTQSGDTVFAIMQETWDDIRFPFMGRRIDVSTGRIDYNYTENTVDFQSNALYPTDVIGMTAQMQHKYMTGSNTHPHLHWIQEQDTIPNFVLEYRIYDNGDTVPTVWQTVKWSSLQTAYTTGDGSVMNIVNFPAIDMSSITGVSAFIDCKIYRDSNNASTLFTGADTYIGTVKTKEFDIHYQIDGAGSDNEYTKSW